MKRLIILTGLMILLFSGVAYADIVILIPKILPPIKMVDSDNPTQEELDALELYQERIENFESIEDWIIENNKFTGTYVEVIDYKKAPIWLNSDGDEMMLFVLKTTRMPNSKTDSSAILGGLNALHSQRDLDFTATDNVGQWLEDNGYTKPSGDK